MFFPSKTLSLASAVLLSTCLLFVDALPPAEQDNLNYNTQLAQVLQTNEPIMEDVFETEGHEEALGLDEEMGGIVLPSVVQETLESIAGGDDVVINSDLFLEEIVKQLKTEVDETAPRDASFKQEETVGILTTAKLLKIVKLAILKSSLEGVKAMKKGVKLVKKAIVKPAKVVAKKEMKKFKKKMVKGAKGDKALAKEVKVIAKKIKKEFVKEDIKKTKKVVKKDLKKIKKVLK